MAPVYGYGSGNSDSGSDSDGDGNKRRQSKSPESDADSTANKSEMDRREHSPSGDSESEPESRETGTKRKREVLTDESASDADSHKKQVLSGDEGGSDDEHEKIKVASGDESESEDRRRSGRGSGDDSGSEPESPKKKGSGDESGSEDDGSKKKPHSGDESGSEDEGNKKKVGSGEESGSEAESTKKKVESGDESGSEAESTKKKAPSGEDSGSDIENVRKKTHSDDESGGEIGGGRRKNVISDDEKDEGEESVDKDLVIDAEALFGNASDISSEDEAGKKGGKPEIVDEDKGEMEEDHEEDEDERERDDGGNEADDIDRDEDKETEPDDQQVETRIDVEVPKITMNLGKELHFIKLPNFLSVETRPFDQASYEDEIDEEETLDEEGRARLKLKVENTIRWREVTGKGGELVKQSNARFVRWSDGSMSLHLGSEIFDVYKQSLHGDHNHLFIRQGTGLQGQAVFRTKLTFRPHSTESFTHRKMTMSLADRSQKTTGIKVLSLVGKDPEAHRGELIKKEEERLRASVRRASKQKRIREKAANRGLSANYLEPDRYNDVDSDEEVISINAIKKQHQNKLANRKGDRPNIYSSDEEGSDIETRRARRLDRAKALKDSDSEEGSGGDGGGGQSRARSSSRED